MNLSKDTSLLKSIDTSLKKTKIIFNARLTDGTNEYFEKADYTSSPFYFYWQNDKGTTVYITNYKICYTETSEPTALNLYHVGAWDSKIGLINSDETDIEAPYITVKDNLDYYAEYNPNETKKQWTANAGWCYPHNFSEAPMEIGVSRKFGQYIAGNFNISEIVAPPRGILQGYYYEN